MNRVASHGLRAAALAGFAAMAALAADNALQTTLARMDRAAAGFTGISTNFRRVHHTALLNEDDVESGTFVLKRARRRELRALWNIQQPDPRTIYFDMRKAEIYVPASKVVQEWELSSYKSLVDTFMVLGFGSTSQELQKQYAVADGGAETVGAEKTEHLVLTPKSADIKNYFTKIELWISDATGLAVQQKLTEPGGNYHLATYSNIMINPSLNDAALEPKYPKGVKREYPQK